MTNPVRMIIAGTPDWETSLRTQVTSPYQLISYTQPTGYIARLTDDQPALILVDGDQSDWQFWTTTPKSSSATRRIPIFLISKSAAIRAKALGVGADLALASHEFLNQFPQLVATYARVLDPALAEQLACECQDPLPPLAIQAVEKFNAGEYYPQHDLFEEQWMHTKEPVRDLYRAVLQVGIAYYQIERGNHRGAIKMLLRSVQWLTMLPDVCQGINVKQLREDSYRVRAELERMAPDDISQFDRSLLKPVQMVEKQ